MDAVISPPGSERPEALPPEQRDFLLLTIFVLSQHGYIDRAGLLAEALYTLGDQSPPVLLARAILRFFKQDWRPALACLEELDRVAPMERFGDYRLTDRQRMRRYLRARCLHELGEAQRARDAILGYLRHGASEGEPG